MNEEQIKQITQASTRAVYNFFEIFCLMDELPPEINGLVLESLKDAIESTPAVTAKEVLTQRALRKVYQQLEQYAAELKHLESNKN